MTVERERRPALAVSTEDRKGNHEAEQLTRTLRPGCVRSRISSQFTSLSSSRLIRQVPIRAYRPYFISLPRGRRFRPWPDP